MSDSSTVIVRTTRQVVENHIDCRRHGRLEDDLADNYHPDVVLLSAEGVNRGHDGVRRLADVLHRYAAGMPFEIHAVHVDGEVGLEQWSAHAEDRHVHDGADTFVVRGGLIVAQTIHFSVRDA